MNSTLQELFQYITDPCDLADSVSAFIQSRSEKFKPTVEAISRVIEGEITPAAFIADTSVYHKWSASLDALGENGMYINLDELVEAISTNIDNISSDEVVKLYNFSGSVHHIISVDEALDRIHSLIGESEMLTTSLNIAQQIADGDSNDFLLNSFAKIDGYLQTTDLSLRLKGIFTSIYEEIRENVNDPIYLVESILVHFGLAGDNADSRKNDVSEYTGQSSLCVLFMDAAEKLGWAINALPQAWRYVIGWQALLVSCIAKLFQAAYRGIQKLTYKAISAIFELGDGVQKTAIPGRGTIKHPGFAIKFDREHTSFPTGADLGLIFEDFERMLGDSADTAQQYTVPVGPVIVYIDWQVTFMRITYDLKPLDYKLYRQVYYNHFNEYPYLSIKAEGGVIKADSTGENLTGKSRLQLQDFIKDLYSHDRLWGMDYDFDSERYMCIQASKHLTSILYALSDTSWNTIDSTFASKCVDACVYIDVTKEHGYNSQTQSFIPENINFASLCTHMGVRNYRVDCFYSYLNDDNELDFTDNSTITQLQSILCDWMVSLGRLCVNVIDNEPLSNTHFFVPYFHKFKLYRPSYYIPTDSDNVSLMKRMIVTGIIVAGVIAAVVIAVYLRGKYRRAVWTMQQQAAQQAFTASEHGDAALMQSGWKLQKRVNLLGVLSGSAQQVSTPVTSGITTVVKSLKGEVPVAGDSEPTLTEIRSLIKPY